MPGFEAAGYRLVVTRATSAVTDRTFMSSEDRGK